MQTLVSNGTDAARLSVLAQSFPSATCLDEGSLSLAAMEGLRAQLLQLARCRPQHSITLRQTAVALLRDYWTPPFSKLARQRALTVMRLMETWFGYAQIRTHRQELQDRRNLEVAILRLCAALAKLTW